MKPDPTRRCAFCSRREGRVGQRVEVRRRRKKPKLGGDWEGKKPRGGHADRASRRADQEVEARDRDGFAP